MLRFRPHSVSSGHQPVRSGGESRFSGDYLVPVGAGIFQRVADSATIINSFWF